MKGKIEKYISQWQERCYSELPDTSPAEIYDKVPSYQRIAIAILKNDYPLQSLGFSPPKSAVYNELKRVEIAARNA